MLLAYYKIKQQVLYKPNLLKNPTGFLITCTIDIYTSAKLQRDHTNPTQHLVCLSFRNALLFGHLIQFKTKYMQVNYKANQKKTKFVIVLVKLLLPYCLGVAGGEICLVVESKAGDK